MRISAPLVFHRISRLGLRFAVNLSQQVNTKYVEEIEGVVC